MAEVLDEKFFIRSSDEGFKNRQADVFAKLNVLEDGHNSAMTSWNNDLKRKLDDTVTENDDDDDNDNDDDDATDKSEENINAINTDEDSFKVPIGIPPKRVSRERNNSVPDYSIHPEKWTKYTLSDVSDECISEDANSEAAIDFLTSRWKTCSDYEKEPENCEDLGSSASFKTGLAKMTDIKFGKINSKLASPSKRLKRMEETKKDDTANVKLSHVDVDTTEYDEEKTDQQPTTTTTVITEQISPQSSEFFRSVRKRQRNIRSVAQDDEVNDD